MVTVGSRVTDIRGTQGTVLRLSDSFGPLVATVLWDAAYHKEEVIAVSKLKLFSKIAR